MNSVVDHGRELGAGRLQLGEGLVGLQQVRDSRDQIGLASFTEASTSPFDAGSAGWQVNTVTP
jgi:hypothetical protein